MWVLCKDADRLERVYISHTGSECNNFKYEEKSLSKTGQSYDMYEPKVKQRDK